MSTKKWIILNKFSKSISDKEKEARKLAKNIGRLMKDQGVSQRELSKRSGIGRSTIVGFLGGNINFIEWYTLYKIAVALNTSMDSLVLGVDIEIIDSPEIREIMVAMPPEAKLFFRSTKRIPKENVKIILDLIKLSVREIEAPAKKRKKRK